MKELFTVSVQVAAPIVVGQDGKNGRRQLIPILGGTVSGADPDGNEMKGIVLPGGVDSQVIRPDGAYRSQTRFGLYRWHITDPIRFKKSLRVTIQALGWRSGGRYLPLMDDIASVAYWYQDWPCAARKPLPSKDELEII